MDLMSDQEERWAQKLAAYEKWLEEVDPADMKFIDTSTLKPVGRLAHLRDEVEKLLVDAIATARQNDWSWGDIGLMLGVTRQAAQQRYGAKVAELPQPPISSE